MRTPSAIAYALATFASGLLALILFGKGQYNRPPGLGLGFAIIVLLFFTAIYSVMIYAYGEASRYIRDEEESESAYATSALIGLLFWFTILPLHKLATKHLGLPDSVWWIESAIICAGSYEIIRFLDHLWTSRKGYQ
jgi:amino acid transporter